MSSNLKTSFGFSSSVENLVPSLVLELFGLNDRMKERNILQYRAQHVWSNSSTSGKFVRVNAVADPDLELRGLGGGAAFF